jgi:hypothetical protein
MISRNRDNTTCVYDYWGIVESSDNWLDGLHSWLYPAWQGGLNMVPLPRLYKTRREAREFCTREKNKLKGRPDLTNEPHGWKMPRVAKIRVTCELVQYE